MIYYWAAKKNLGEKMDKKLKVYCETSFWSWLVSRPSTDPDHAVKQAWTRKWWEEIAPRCDIYVSGYVLDEAAKGDESESAKRIAAAMKCLALDGEAEEAKSLASKLIEFHAVPEKEKDGCGHRKVRIFLPENTNAKRCIGGCI